MIFKAFFIYKAKDTLHDPSAPYTPKECERMNGFDDDWTALGSNGEEITDRKRYFLMGNALVVGLVEKMGHKIDEITLNYK